MHALTLARRHLLQAGGCLLVALAAPRDSRAQSASRVLATDQVDGFLAIGRDGGVTLYSGKVDLGTGRRAAWRQIVAEELDLDPAHIAVVEGDTALTPDQGPTSGSTGIQVGGMRFRRAAATARAALLKLAAARLGAAEAALELADGAVRVRGNNTGIGFAALLDGKAFDLKLDPRAPLKKPAEYRVVGRPFARPDLPGKLTGQHVYVHDFKLPGMLHGRVIRPPAVGARLLSVDEKSIAAIPGARVVRLQNFLAVAAPREWHAVRAARELKATWSAAETLPGSDKVFDTLRAAKVARDEVLASRGDATARLARAEQVLSATYQWPMQSHASLGPSCAVADVTANRATVWTASQATHKYRGVFADFLGLPAAAVRLVYLDGAGCYGMNGHDDAAADAALMSRALGKPVRVQWTRADEHGWDPKGPAQLLDVRGALDGQGRIAAWETRAWLPANTPNLPGVSLLGPADAGLSQPKGQSSGLTHLNADPPYAVADMHTVIHWTEGAPLRLSNLRAPGKIGNVLAVECFTDELAAAAKADPLAFRRAALTDPRGLEVLRRLEARMGWQARPSPAAIDPKAAVLKGRGLAYCHYKQRENFVAIGMEVEVERATGTIRVTRAVCAHDCGQIISPDGVLSQVEGGILQTISRTLFEEVTFDRARVTSTDWASYPILTFPDAPRLEIELIDRPEEPPFGAGEAATAPVAAAIGNAVFDATGVRLRTVPFTAARMKVALAGRA